MHYSQNDFIFRVRHFKADVIGPHCYKMYTYSYIILYIEANNAKSLFQFSNNKLM